MGRPRKTLTDEQKQEVETLSAVLNQAQMADYFGLEHRTFQKILEREPEIYASYKRGKAKAIGSVAQSLIQQARSGNTSAMIFFLKTQAKWRETSHVDHTSSDGSMSPQKIELVAKS